MQNFIINIENKINTLDAGITLNRKGIKNTVKMNLGEILLRNIADLLFLIQDYDQAANFYKQAANEFKFHLFAVENFAGKISEKILSKDYCVLAKNLGKSVKNYANSMEMWIYATILSESLMNRKEIDALFETFELVFNQYYTSQEYMRFAARSLLFLIRAQYIYQKFNKDLIRIVNDQSHKLKESFPIYFPLILEQQSILYLKLNPIMPRKYVMHLLFSGHKYYHISFKNNALRCFMIAYDYYKPTKWHLINGFIMGQLSKYFREVEDFSNYLSYLKMSCNHLSSKDTPDKQQSTMIELSKVDKLLEHLLKENQLSKEKHKQIVDGKVELGLPRVNEKSIDIIHESEAIFYVNEKRYDPLRLFVDREQRQQPAGSEMFTWFQLGDIVNSQLDSKTQLSIAGQIKEKAILKTFDCMFLEEKNHLFNSKDRTCYVGDEVLLSFSFVNPIKIEYEIKELKPLYEISSNSSAQAGLQMTELVEIETKDIQVNNVSQDVTCILKLKPKIQGSIKVVGVMWDLMGLPIKHIFELKGKKNKDGKTHEKNLKNCFEIVPNTTKLSFAIENFQENIYYGEIRSFEICFKNEGVDRIDKIILSTSAPHIFGFNHLSFSVALESGEELKKKIFFRGSVHFRGQVKILVKYVSAVNIHKYIRILLPFKVLASFEIYPQALPCNSNYLVNLQIEEYLSMNTQKLQKTMNLLDMEDFYILNIKQVFILSNDWHFDENASSKGQLNKSFVPLYVKPVKEHSKVAEVIEIDLSKELGPLKIGFDYNKLAEVNFTFEQKKWLVLSEPDARNNWKQLSMKKIFDNFVKEDQKKILENGWDRDENFFDSNLLGLGIYWEFKTETGELIRGLHSINKVYMNAALLKSPSIKLNVFDKNPLVHRVYTPTIIYHDFEKSRIGQSEIEVVLTNYFSEEPVSFKIEFVNGDETFQNKYDIIFPFFTWEGIVERDIKDLKKQESVSLKLKMCFYEYGLYDIMRFRITFYRNRYSHQLVNPVLQRNQETARNLESKTYYPGHEEYLIKVEKNDV